MKKIKIVIMAVISAFLFSVLVLFGDKKDVKEVLESMKKALDEKLN